MKERLSIKSDLSLIKGGEVINIMNSFISTLNLNFVEDSCKIEKGIFVLEGDRNNLFKLKNYLNSFRVEGKEDVSPFTTEDVFLE